MPQSISFETCRSAADPVRRSAMSSAMRLPRPAPHFPAAVFETASLILDAVRRPIRAAATSGARVVSIIGRLPLRALGLDQLLTGLKRPLRDIRERLGLDVGEELVDVGADLISEH